MNCFYAFFSKNKHYLYNRLLHSSFFDFIFTTVNSIINYKDFRKYMQDFYDERKRTSAFSWREFNKLAGFTSPNFLKLVTEGKSRLSKVKAGCVANAMGLVGYEQTYFELLVHFDNAKDDLSKKTFYLNSSKLRKNTKSAPLIETHLTFSSGPDSYKRMAKRLIHRPNKVLSVQKNPSPYVPCTVKRQIMQKRP